MVSRGRGERKRDVPVVSTLFPRYVLVHLPADPMSTGAKRSSAERHRNSPAVGLLTGHEAKFNGVAGLVSTCGRPVSVPDALVERIVVRERAGEFNRTVRDERGRAVSKLPDWMRPGALVNVASGPFADFPGEIEEVDAAAGRLKVGVMIFGRLTPVELGVADVASLC